LAEQAIAFPVEDIPDSDSVFMRAHKNLMPNGVVVGSVFRSQDDSMSVDWERYSTPEATRLRARGYPEDNAVLKLGVGGIRKISDLQVAHSPLPDNRAHTDVFLPRGEDLTEVRYRLAEIAEIAIPFTSATI
jgi:hypothetical protein